VALVVALVMLVVIALTSAAVMRGSLSADMITNNARLQTLARQAAQAALAYCERASSLTPPTVPILPDPGASAPGAWETYGNWSDPTKVVEVPSSVMASSGSTFVPPHLPQCMTEQALGGDAYVVTARGFSPDYSVNAQGYTTSGSVVWLQSTVLFTP